ncbi:DUF4112 domain-containing protein [Propionibacteriaceae bacterium G1746]|uniref:DUF4112 domain-containing protein n=1 Tax=Aestuariimicrobium sp. G57 TaxID=3418485 RepID=UPI003C170DB2
MPMRHDEADATAAKPAAGKPAEAQPAGTQAAMGSDVLAMILDDLVTIPGTKFGIGLDGLLGLIPGVGDGVTTSLGGIIMVDAIRRRVPVTVLVKMAMNLLVDTALGYVPLVGDAADFAHRANRKNYKLLKAAITEGRFETHESYGAYMVKAIGILVGVLVLMIGSAVFALWMTITLLMQLIG